MSKKLAFFISLKYPFKGLYVFRRVFTLVLES